MERLRLTREQQDELAAFGSAVIGVVPDTVPGAFEVDMRHREAAAIERVQTQMLLDEFRELPVGNRLAAKYWALRTTVSPLALEAHQMASVTLLNAREAMARRHEESFGPLPAEARV